MWFWKINENKVLIILIHTNLLFLRIPQEQMLIYLQRAEVELCFKKIIGTHQTWNVFFQQKMDI